MDTDLESVVARLAEQVERRYYGKYRGFVVDNADPEKLGRLALTVPSVLGEDVVTGWAVPCVPYGGAADQGFLFIPEIGAGVWVEFEEGDLEFPIWVGTFWSKPGGESELPKPLGSDAVQDPPTCKVLKTRGGHTIELEDQEGEEKVTIRHKEDHKIVISAEGIEISAKSKSITLDATSIALGAGASEPVILGKKFLEVFNSHTHPTAVGLSGIPAPQLSPAHMSPGVKAK